jgi:putative hydrolase of the HAD superfamily
MALQAVLFDAGDTLFRVRGSVGEVYATVAARHGVVRPAADLEPCFRAAFRRMPPLGFPGAAPADLPRLEEQWWRTVVRATFDGVAFVDFDAFFDDLYAHFACADVWEVFPDVRPTLAALRGRGLRLAVVSNFDGRLATICHAVGLATAFDTIVMSGRTGYAKPDPRIFGAALDRLGVAASAALHVGDSEREDVAGARAAGIAALWLRRDGGSAPNVTCISDLRMLPAWIEGGARAVRA